MENLIFIGGIHGVGKGTICQQISKEFDYIHLSASEVLKWDEISILENKIVENIDLTQDRLIRNLNKIVSKDKNYILDGHFCLLNKKRIAENINEDVFIQINPKIFVIVVDNIKQIKLRLEKRDNQVYDIELLYSFQELELEYSKEISKKLNRPLLIIEKGNINQLKKILKNESTT